MQNQLNELKQKCWNFSQLVKSKINHKKSEKVSGEAVGWDRWESSGYPR